MIPLNQVPASSVYYIYFSTYGKTNGESITLTGLAVTDIEIYKNGSVTQRASDAGYALLDTDGIDFDAITGIHGFSIDLADNTDAGFYAVGSQYVVVVSAVTVDSQTVNFIADRFRIVAAESIAGKPKVDVDALVGDAQSATDLKDFADGGYDPATNKVQGVVLTDTLTTYTGNTPQTGDVFPLASTEIADIKAKTDNLPSDPADQSLIIAATDAIIAAIAALNNLSAAAVNAEVVDVLRTDTVAELAAIPAASPNLHAMLQLVYMALRNKIDVTATAKEIHNDAGTVLATKTLSDDGTTYSETKMA